MAFAKNTRTGKTTSVPDHYIGHPVLGKDLIAIDGNVEASPKKEKKSKAESKGFSWAAPADKTEEQPAPETTLENEENEDGN
jgi:hypothetical protein